MTSSSARKHTGTGPATDLPPVSEPTFAERAHTLVYLGLSDNIADAYQFLMRNFEQEDQLYIFGFSRGA